MRSSQSMGLLFAVVISLVCVTPSGAEQPKKPTPPAPARAPAPAPAPVVWESRIEAIGEDHSSLLVVHDDRSVTLTVKGKELQTRLKGFRTGDLVAVEVTEEGDQKVLRNLSAGKVVRVDRWRRVRVLFFSGLGVLIFAGIVLRGRLPMLLVGKDGRYSNSKFQIVVWFGVVVVTYLTTVWLRWWEGGGPFIGGVDLPQNLLLLSGISAFTFAAAKGITTARVEAARAAAQAAGQDPEAAAERTKRTAGIQDRWFLTNLVCDDNGRPDIGDFQMLVITLLAVAVYLLQVFAFLGSIELLKVVTVPDVDTTILATFGLGQGAYLTKKYAGEGV